MYFPHVPVKLSYYVLEIKGLKRKLTTIIERDSLPLESESLDSLPLESRIFLHVTFISLKHWFDHNTVTQEATEGFNLFYRVK